MSILQNRTLTLPTYLLLLCTYQLHSHPKLSLGSEFLVSILNLNTQHHIVALDGRNSNVEPPPPEVEAPHGHGRCRRLHGGCYIIVIGVFLFDHLDTTHIFYPPCSSNHHHLFVLHSLRVYGLRLTTSTSPTTTTLPLFQITAKEA